MDGGPVLVVLGKVELVSAHSCFLGSWPDHVLPRVWPVTCWVYMPPTRWRKGWEKRGVEWVGGVGRQQTCFQRASSWLLLI